MTTNRGSVVKDDDLNVLLLALVEYLGHNNQIVSGTAFSEVSSKFSGKIFELTCIRF
jgi:hypothetical protein